MDGLKAEFKQLGKYYMKHIGWRVRAEYMKKASARRRCYIRRRHRLCYAYYVYRRYEEKKAAAKKAAEKKKAEAAKAGKKKLP